MRDIGTGSGASSRRSTTAALGPQSLDGDERCLTQTCGRNPIPRLIGDRPRGPLFLTDRRPAPGRAPALVDICPFTGRARQSYRRAEEIFCDASGGWTLHQLRHSAITHLAEDNVALPMLMAKSRHTSLRSLQKYARPSADAVAALTAAHDPERRRR